MTNATMTTAADRIVTARIKCWGRNCVRSCMVSRDGTVRVWDDIAYHYTTCHGLTESQMQRIRRLAN